MKRNRTFSEIAELERLNPITEKIIGCAYKVSNGLGAGFLEKVYENALALEIRKTGMKCSQSQPLKVWYDGVVVGDYEADLVVEDRILIELKTVKALSDVHRAQCLNYLKATGIRICLLLNFGNPHLEIMRIVL